MKNAWDIHVHAAPSLFERRGDAWDLAEAALAAGMAGVVIKSHHGSTVETAALLSRRFPELKIFGGLTLNEYAGGLNPYAVEVCLRLGGRIVWLPTIHARHHGAAVGDLGGFGFQENKARRVPAQGISLLGEAGELKPAVRDIVDLLDGAPAVLGTGHVSLEEIRALQSYIRRERRSIRLLINHAFFKAPALTAAHVSELKNPWTWFETVYFSSSPICGATTVAAVAETLLAVPDAQWVLASDSGQKGGPVSPEALSLFSKGLAACGVSEGALDAMLRERPADLLQLEHRAGV